ncbi:MAG: hypothetical protein QOF67_884, partial [Mycobacterium sp.]|nr:hypothetical protein [Mycobacterium sp.]
DDGAQHLKATIICTTHVFTSPSRSVDAYFTVINSGDTAREALRVAKLLVASSLWGVAPGPGGKNQGVAGR